MMKVGRLIELEAAVAVKRRRSFRAAAADVGLSPTALSQVIAGLETRLGVRLFHRTTRSVAMTAAGEQFVASVAPALTAIRDATDAVNSHRASPTGLLRLNTSIGAARRLLTPLILAYLRRYPSMSVDLVTDGRLIDIVREGFDAGFRLRDQVPADMVAVPLGRDERMVLVAAPSYLATRAAPEEPADLIGHDCVRLRLPSGIVYRWEFERDGHPIVFDPVGRLTLDDGPLIREAALGGLGIAYVSYWEVGEDLAAGRLVQMLDAWTPPYPGLCLYYPGRRHVPAGLKALAALVQEQASARRESAARTA
jgi:DNA-binding transcriptional LysR family regulator